MANLSLITENLWECVNLSNLKSKEHPRIYWGTAPTGKPHLGYLIPMLKIRDFVRAGCDVTILLADLHAFLDSLKSPFDQIQVRTDYYIHVIRILLETVGLTEEEIASIRFVKGSEYQLRSDYVFDLLKLAAQTSIHDAKKAGADVVKQDKNPMLGGLLYPLMQALDEKYLEADAEFGGVDQRKIFMFSYDSPHTDNITYLMNPIVGLKKKGKMSSSDASTKIDFEDSLETLETKIQKCFSVDKQIENNGLILLVKVAFEFTPTVAISRPDEYGGNVEYDSLGNLLRDFEEGSLGSVDIKNSLTPYIYDIVNRVYEKIDKELLTAAYNN